LKANRLSSRRSYECLIEGTALANGLGRARQAGMRTAGYRSRGFLDPLMEENLDLMNVARSLGIVVPPTPLTRVDEVIE
jgi:hypothetical protein